MISFRCRLARPRFVLDAGFETPDGCVALFGASGSGKTTVARLIAGLERPDHGRIVVNGRTLVDTEAGVNVPAHKRRVGLVFQDGQLLPHLSVRQNLEYGCRFAPPGAEAAPFASVIELLGIGHLLDARPGTLSGGERQRVAIGRALLAAPRILVMDEPLASLDARRKLEILPFIERLRDEFAIPIVYVSHAVEEVVRIATRVVRLAGGRAIAEGPPNDVLTRPVEHGDVDRFEVVSILAGTVVREMPEFAMTVLAHPAGEITLPGRFGADGKTLRVAIRATNVTLALEEPKGISVRTVLKGRVRAISMQDGASALVVIDLVGGDRLSAYLSRLAISDLSLSEGREVFALLKAVSIDERSIGIT